VDNFESGCLCMHLSLFVDFVICIVKKSGNVCIM
jgi:hypothetical protein